MKDKSNKFVKIVCLFCCLVFATSSFACQKNDDTVVPPVDKPEETIKDTQYDLYSGGKSDYKIVLPTSPSEAELYSAEEFNLFFSEASGITLDILSDEGKTFDENNSYISIGKTALLAGSNIKIDYDALGADGYKIATKGKQVLLCGARDRGTLYSVYEFLRHSVGFEVYAANEIHVDKEPSAKIKAFDLTDKPDFSGRDSHFYNTIFNADFSARMRQNGVRVNLDAKHGSGLRTEWCNDWAHSFLALLPPKDYYATHSDWYSGSGVLETPPKGQICLTNEGGKAELIKNLKIMIEEQSDAKYFAVAQEDNGVWCTCTKCLDSKKKYTLSGTLIRFVNEVSREIHKWADVACPERELYIETFAYQLTTAAPVTVDNGVYTPIDPSCVPDDDVVVRITSIWNCFSHDLMNDTCNDSFRQSILGWSSITKKMMVWNYGANFHHYLLNFDNWSIIKKNYETFKKYNVFDILDNGAFDSPSTSFQALRVYLQSKLMWKVDQDVNVLTNNFFDNYYKNASQYVKEYYDLTRIYYETLDAEKASKGKDPLHMFIYNDFAPKLAAAENYDRRYLERCMQIFDNAYKKINEEVTDVALRDMLLSRVKAESLQPRYLILANYSYYYDISLPKYKEEVDSFARDCTLVGLTRICEGTPIDTFIDTLRTRIV